MRNAIFGYIIWAFIIIVDVCAWLTINVPAGVQYSNLFGSYVTMAYEGQPTFQGIQVNLQHIYNNMNTEFAGFDYNQTFNSYWGWNHVYENSLQAERDYLVSAMNRTHYYEQEFSGINSTSQYTDTYNQALTNLRNEMQGCTQVQVTSSGSTYYERQCSSTGSLDWALKGAWYLYKAPAAYWDIYYLSLFTVICGLLGLGLIVSDSIR
jgi:hypothetical protein